MARQTWLEAHTFLVQALLGLVVVTIVIYASTYSREMFVATVVAATTGAIVVGAYYLDSRMFDD